MMINVREIFGKNLKRIRHECGFTQEKLAEKAGVSIHYISMIEISRNFPKSEIIERLANALNIEVYELFLTSRSHIDEMERQQQLIITAIKQTISESIETSLETALEKMTKSEKTKKNGK